MLSPMIQRSAVNLPRAATIPAQTMLGALFRATRHRPCQTGGCGDPCCASGGDIECPVMRSHAKAFWHRCVS